METIKCRNCIKGHSSVLVFAKSSILSIRLLSEPFLASQFGTPEGPDTCRTTVL